MRLDKRTLWAALLSCIGISFFAAVAVSQDGTVAALEPIPDEVLVSDEPLPAPVPHPTALGSRLEDTAEAVPGETNHDFLEGVADEVDTRVWSLGYWMEMAELGLAPYSPDTPFEPAVETPFAAVDSTDVAVTTNPNATQSENSIFVNPNDTSKLLNSNNSTDWNGVSVTTLYGSSGFMSTDGGSTWSGSVNGTGGNNSGDPAAAIDLSGRYYVGYIAAGGGQGVANSTNEGSTWTHVQVAPNPGSLADKNHLWVDNRSSSPNEGNLYSAWTDFGGVNDSDIVVSRSTDGGLTWSATANISSAVTAGSHNQGVNLQTGPNGEAYAVWAIYDSWPSDETALGFASSTNGGATWSTGTRIISNIRGIRTTTTSKNHRVNSFPVMAVDISDGPNSGDIYVVWSNIGVPGINTGPDIDVYVIESSDGGATWSSPLKVNQDPIAGKEHYFPWIGADPVTGDLHVIFYADRNVTSTQNEVFVASSTDGGSTWTDFKVSDVAFTPSPVPGLAAGYFGDYLGVVARGGLVYPTWTDNRSGRVLAYVSPFDAGSEAPCLGGGLNLQTPNFYATVDGEGDGRAIGFQADQDFELNAVSIRGDLLNGSYDVVIYDSPDGHTAGTVLATFSGTTGGTGNGWNTLPVSFQFDSGSYYVVNWRPSAPGNWANTLDYYNDDALPYAVGPVNILEGFDGFNADNPINFLHPHFSFCTTGSCSVAVLGAPATPAWNDEVQSKLLGTGRFASVDVIDVSTTTPSLAELQAYAAVLVFSDTGFQNAATLGDNLADYVDAGGGVVVAVFADASVPIGGRFDSGNYWAIAPSGQTQTPEEFLGTIYDPSHPILAGVTAFSGGSSSYRTSTFDVAAGATRIADWTDGRPLVATTSIGGTRRADLGFYPPSSDSRGDFWDAGTDGALLMANALDWVKDATCEECDREEFPDPLGTWHGRRFYTNTNAESYYVASGNCDPDYRGNQPDGIWISDDRGCGNLVSQSPVRIDFLNTYGDDKTSFSLDHFTCVADVTLNVYDKDGALVVSDPLTEDCFNWSTFSTPLTNGISAFEYAYTSGDVEGNTSIDNVELCGAPAPECTTDEDCDNELFCDGVETCNAGTCMAGTPPNCDDGVSCTVDSCNEGADSCDNVPNDALCDDGAFCNGDELCDPILDCQPGTDPCLPGETCDEVGDMCVADPCTPVTTFTVSSGVIPPGASGGVDVTTSNALGVGSSDVVVNFNPAELQATGASSATLSSFTFFIDNVAGTVTTASASAGADALGAGDTLFTVTFQNVGIPPAGTSTITLSDADGDACDDVAGPVPPIPPLSLPYDQVPGSILGGVLGDVSCDGALSPIDASVILGLFVGLVQLSDLPPPCNDMAHLLAVSDWDLSGTLNPIDASITLGIFVGNFTECDTPLGQSVLVCPPSPSAASAAMSAAPEQEARVRVGRASAGAGQSVTVAVTTRRALDVGSTGLSFSYDPGALEVVSVDSRLDGFTYNVEGGVIRTASAGLGQQLRAGDELLNVTFQVRADAARGQHAVTLVGEPLIGSSVSGGVMPSAADVRSRPGWVRVR